MARLLEQKENRIKQRFPFSYIVTGDRLDLLCRAGMKEMVSHITFRFGYMNDYYSYIINKGASKLICLCFLAIVIARGS